MQTNATMFPFGRGRGKHGRVFKDNSGGSPCAVSFAFRQGEWTSPSTSMAPSARSTPGLSGQMNCVPTLISSVGNGIGSHFRRGK